MESSKTTQPKAVVLANGLLESVFAKTTHGLIRGPSRYPLAGVIDPRTAGRDAGEVLDGQRRDLPVYASLDELFAVSESVPGVCIVGVATVGGVLPEELYSSLLQAAEAGMTLVNGLHRLLSDDERLVELTREHGGEIIDLRKPRPVGELRFWSGEALSLEAPRLAVLGIDCAVGKRTTSMGLRQACRARGLATEMIYTGQTGWLQGAEHGFILDATPNDFVCGEMERAILDCARDKQPDLILLEGQSGLRNPSGPCGFEHILAAGSKGVVLQHVPGRAMFIDMEEVGARLPPVEEEIQLIRLLGADVWALTLNAEGLDNKAAEVVRARLEERLELPVFLPLRDGFEALAEVVAGHIAVEGGA